MIEEIWKVYKETYNRNGGRRIYEVSNFGRIKRNGEIIEPKQNGYLGVGCVCIHRAVAELFIPNPENKPQVDHIDTDIYNNHYTNLRWVTPKENMNNPLTKQHQKESLKGIVFSTEHINNLKKSQIGKHDGEKNGMYGKHLSEETKRKQSEKLKSIFKDRKWINNGEIEKWINKNNIEEYLSNGYKLGRLNKNISN